MHEEDWILVVLSLMIFAGVAVLWMAMWNRRAMREMEHRERLAMIQQGLMPAPEADPLAFDTQLSPPTSLSTRQERWRSSGILIIGLGLALMVLLTFTGAEDIGFALGGAFAVLGVSFLFNASQLGRSVQAPVARPMARRPTPPTSAGPPSFDGS